MGAHFESRFDVLRHVGRRSTGVLLLVWLFCLALLQATVDASAGVTALRDPNEKRLALVVTNQDYEPELIPLKFTHADGEIIAAALQRTGFEVQVLRDGGRKAFLQALAEFERKLHAAGPNAVAFFYFSGHCWANETSNYIILDEQLSKPIADLSIKARFAALPQLGVALQAITAMIGRQRAKASFVVIDSHLDIAEPALIADGTGKPPAGQSHRGIILSAQGRPGMPAWDSNDYSKALSGAILTPGLTASEVFKQVQVKVAEVTNGKNVPWVEDRLLSTFHFTPLPTETPGAAPAPRTERADVQLPQLYDTTSVLAGDLPQRVEDALWDAVVNTPDARLYQAYLATYPQGRYVEPARTKLAALASAPQLLPASPASTPAGNPAANPASRRVALIIGNAAYKHETPLLNPANDAKAIAQTLRGLGFAEVREVIDAGRSQMLDALREFDDLAASADWAVIYFSGHGLEAGGVNYLIPVDARLATETAVEDEAIPLDRLIDRTARARQVRFLIVDACRTSQFPRRWSGGGATKGGRGKGLVAIKAETGTVIAFAAEPGQTADDGTGTINPYAAALARHLGADKDIRLMLGDVYDAMVEQKALNQRPWFHAALGGKVTRLKP